MPLVAKKVISNRQRHKNRCHTFKLVSIHNKRCLLCQRMQQYLITDLQIQISCIKILPTIPKADTVRLRPTGPFWSNLGRLPTSILIRSSRISLRLYSTYKNNISLEIIRKTKLRRWHTCLTNESLKMSQTKTDQCCK